MLRSLKTKLLLTSIILVFFCAPAFEQGTQPVPNSVKIYNVMAAPYNALCNGSSNDTSIIQTAILAAAGNGRVYIPSNGVCTINAQITVPSASYITNDGTIQLANSSNVYMFMMTGVTNVVFDGFGILDGNRANNTTSAGLYDNGSSNITVRDLTIKNMAQWAVNFTGTNTCELDNLKLIGNFNASEFAMGATNCWAYGLKISNTVGDDGFAFYGGVTYSGMIGGSITGSHVSGVSVFNDSGQPAANHDITISGVTSSLNQDAGFEVYNNGGTGPSYNVSITGNTGYENGQSGVALGCVRVQNANNVNIVGNTCSYDGSGSVSVSLTGINSNISVKANTIIDPGQGGTSGTGLFMGNNASSSICTNCTFQANDIIDDQGSHTMEYAVAGAMIAGDHILYNNTIGWTTLPYNLTFTDSVDFITSPGALGAATLSAMNGGSFTVQPYSSSLFLHSSGISSFSITLTANRGDHSVVTISCDGAISTLTISSSTGTVAGAPSSCPANSAFSLIWNETESLWLLLSNG